MPNKENSTYPEKSSGTDEPIDLVDVLAAELEYNRPEAKHPDRNLHDVVTAMHDADLKALCFSGGGIRSATFGLGVVQALAKHGLLPEFDYLSTVSGGGYLGSWFSAWVFRATEIDKETGKKKRLKGEE